MNSGWKDATSGDTAWGQWLGDHGPGFLLFARQQTRFEVDAQDLVQEAVVECWSRQAIDAPPAAGLVFATIRRRAIDWGRTRDKRAVREAIVAGETPESWFDGSVEDRERSQLVQSALSRLPDIYREVLTLKVWGELTFAEIGKTLEIPVNTAASRYRYGLAEMRKLTKQVFP